MGTECGCGFDKYCPHDTKRTQFFDDNLKIAQIQIPSDEGGPSFRREPNQPSKHNRNKFPPAYYEDKGITESYIPCGESSMNMTLIIVGVIFFIATISTMVIILNKG